VGTIGVILFGATSTARRRRSVASTTSAAAGAAHLVRRLRMTSSAVATRAAICWEGFDFGHDFHAGLWGEAVQ